MNTSKHIAKQLRDLYTGGNWTAVNLKDTLKNVDHEQAHIKVQDFNTLVTLVFHINYYVEIAIKVLNGGPLEGKDSESFDHPSIATEAAWEDFKSRVLKNGETLAELIEIFPNDRLEEAFAGSKYGSYYRNLQGVIEHTHYHLGQITLIKKLVNSA